MLPQWSKEYSVHNFLIDEQHKKLFELANMANDMLGKQTDRVEIKKILAALFEYMKTHFKDEEAYMESIHYPSLEAHREKHKEIILEMTLLLKNIKHDFKQQLAIITGQWLLKHILQEDMRIGEYQQEILSKNKEQQKKLQKSEDNILEDSVVESEDSKDKQPKDDSVVQSAKAIKKNDVLHIYSCACGKIYNIPTNVHTRIQNGQAVHCKNCNTNITYINDMKV